MKRFIIALICLTLCSLLSFTLLVYAEDVGQTEEASLQFRGITWYLPKADVDELLAEEGGQTKSYSDLDWLCRLTSVEYSNVYPDLIKGGGGILSKYSGLSVAGYEPSETRLNYIYQVDPDGNIIRDDSSAEFYLRFYKFDSSDYQDHRALFDDLSSKLITLYGDPEQDADKYKSTETWMDSNGNTIRLLINADENFVSLMYMAGDADEKLEAMRAALDAEALAEEESQREQNKEDLSGL